MSLFFKNFTSHNDFYQYLGTCSEELNIEEMIKQSRPRSKTIPFYIADYEGYHIACKNMKQLIKLLNEDFGFKFIPSKCYNRGPLVYLFSSVDYDVEKVIRPELEQEEIITMQDLDEDSVIEEEKIDHFPALDPEFYRKLFIEGNIAESKDILQREVKKDHGITLKKNRVFDRMIEDLYTLKETGSFE